MIYKNKFIMDAAIAQKKRKVDENGSATVTSPVSTVSLCIKFWPGSNLG